MSYHMAMDKDWIDTPGLKYQLTREVPLAGKLLAEGKYPILVRGMPRIGKTHIRNKVREASELETIQKGCGVINCAAIPESLVESILFGYKKGAFSGAEKDTRGLLFDNSVPPKVVFLEEIGELPKHVQAKLLVFFDTRSVMPVGAGWGGEEKSTIRIIATSNADDDKFRPDFLQRFWEIEVWPLYQRREDIPYFLELFLEGFEDLAPHELIDLMGHNWPKGITELEKICLTLKHLRIPPEIGNIPYANSFANLYEIFCRELLEQENDDSMLSLFPHFYLYSPDDIGSSPLDDRMHINKINAEKIAKEWKAWCYFFGLNENSPIDVYEDRMKNKKELNNDWERTTFESLKGNIESYTYTDNLSYFIDFLKKNKSWNKKGWSSLVKLRTSAFEKLSAKSEEENKTEDVISQYSISPSEYEDKFFEYHAKIATGPIKLAKLCNINRNTASKKLEGAKKRIDA